MIADEFKAITWNVFHGTPVAELRPILEDQLHRGVSLLLMNEAGGRDLDAMLGAADLHTYLAPRQYRVAWDPNVWTAVTASRVRLSETSYYAQGGDGKQYSDAARVILSDYAGRTVEVVCYHTPAHVQTKTRPERRYRAAVESMAELGRIADRSLAAAFLAGGDDNVDESVGIGAGTDLWRAFLEAGNGLQQIQAPAGTHGKRRIDDFRIVRGGALRPGDGWVSEGGGDHRIHGRLFKWRLR